MVHPLNRHVLKIDASGGARRVLSRNNLHDDLGEMELDDGDTVEIIDIVPIALVSGRPCFRGNRRARSTRRDTPRVLGRAERVHPRRATRRAPRCRPPSSRRSPRSFLSEHQQLPPQLAARRGTRPPSRPTCSRQRLPDIRAPRTTWRLSPDAGSWSLMREGGVAVSTSFTSSAEKRGLPQLHTSQGVTGRRSIS
jgi:hypothetical protein